MKIAWFSAGITSTVACKLALEKYDDVEIYYIETGAHHPDNARFIRECEAWYGQRINIIRNSKGYSSHIDVIRKHKVVNTPHGFAPCTKKLKKEPRYELEDRVKYDNQIFGFEYSQHEINRAIRFKEQYPHTNPLYPLIEARLNKDECAGILVSAGIELPAMYLLGYSNNNCIGCVKGGKGYWNKIRQDFPDVFAEMASAEREVGGTCLKHEDGPKWLDELPPHEGNIPNAVIPNCGMFCQIEFVHIMDARVEDVMKGEKV